MLQTEEEEATVAHVVGTMSNHQQEQLAMVAAAVVLQEVGTREDSSTEAQLSRELSRG